MIFAYPRFDGFGQYNIVGDRPSETFSRKESFKKVGATWDGRHWIADLTQLAQLGIEVMTRVEAHCGRPEHIQRTYVPVSKAVIGARVYGHCGWCDGRTFLIVSAIDDDQDAA